MSTCDLDEMEARRDALLNESEALAKRDHERQVRLDNARGRAREILEHGNPREFILNTFKTLHIGDNDTAEGILIGTMNQSIANSKGIQSAVHGESGYGKSHAARAMLHVHPEEYYMITSLSDKALFYMEADELRPGMTIFCDDAAISDGIEGIIKRATGAFQEATEHRVPMKEGGKYITKKLSIPPRLVWLLTSVDSQGSDQFVKRQISYGVDETSEQDDEVIRFELEKAREGLPEFPVTDEVLICREMIRLIKEGEQQRLFTVKTPFADRIEWLDKQNRRNLLIIFDMVKGYAVLNSFARAKSDDGALIAIEDDFNAAARLYNSRGGFQKLHITEREKEMLQFIAKARGELATNDLMEVMKLSDVRIGQIGDRLKTVLSGFHIERRSVRVQDPNDTGKSTTTQRNYYCYDGDVNLDLFGSVVSLHPSPNPNPKKEIPLEALEEHSNIHSNSTDFECNEAHTALKEPKEDNNIIINNKNIPLEVLERESIENIENNGLSIRSLGDPSSAHEVSQSGASTTFIPSIEGGNSSDEKLRVLFERPSRDLRALRLLIRNILLTAKDVGIDIDNKERLADAIVNEIKRQHVEWRGYDILGFYKKLEENDTEIQGMIADLTGGR